MKHLGIAALTALTLAAGAWATPLRAAAEPLLDDDYVSQLMAAAPDDPDAAIRVLFGRHAAIYRLERNDPNFAAWFDILARSLKERTHVRFGYAVAGQRLTAVEPA